MAVAVAVEIDGHGREVSLSRDRTRSQEVKRGGVLRLRGGLTAVPSPGVSATIRGGRRAGEVGQGVTVRKKSCQAVIGDH